MACVAVNSLVRTLELEFMQPHPRPIFQQNQIIPSNIDLIQSLHQKLQFLIDLFDESRMDRDEAIKHLETQLRDVAFRAEDEIELFVTDLNKEKNEEFGIAALFGEKPYMKVMVEEEELHSILQKAIEDIDGIKEKYKQARVALQRRKTTPNAFPKSDDDEVIRKGDSDSQSENNMVGKNDEFDTVMRMLIQNPSQNREVVSIKGMGGIGKTTLARRVYNDSSVASYFDKRAWVVASQNHDEKKMLKDLLKSMGKEESNNDENEAVKKCLMGQRYLAVIDDIWSTEAWDAMHRCFPDEGYRSRILLTTRNAEVASYTCSTNGFSHQMKVLDPNESWNLFSEKAKAYRYEEVEVERILRPIVKKCGGLPLAITVVAGLFSKLNTVDEWINIANTLNSSATTTISEECSRILSLSYNHLPHNLRACFLYLGVFPEDQEITTEELASLWAAEGLVKASEDESFDAMAEKYIRELMDRNLIIARGRSRCGRKMRTFMMHDLLHAFCVSEAHKENLLLVVRENNDFNLPQKCFRWVSIQLKNFDILSSHSSLKRCRSIFWFSDILSLNLDGFSALRVIYYSRKYMPKTMIMEDVTHVRFLLNPWAHVNLFKFADAWNVQRVSIWRASGVLNFLEFPQLQYFQGEFFGRTPKFLHPSVQKISYLRFKNCTKELFSSIPYLKEVKIYVDLKDFNDCIKNLAYLQQLESLFVFIRYQNTIQMNNPIFLLKNLKNLEICDTRFEWKEINVLCKLTRLEVLELSKACVDEEWELQEEEKFCQLIWLKIFCYDLKHWEANNNNFPRLEHLVFHWCTKLREIPNEFAGISTLKSIKLFSCLPSAVTSAKQIEEEKHEIGDDDFVVIEERTLSPMSLWTSDDEDEQGEVELNKDESDADVLCM